MNIPHGSPFNRLVRGNSTTSKRVLPLAFAVLAGACATLPRPEALGIAQRQEALPVSQETKELAPQMFAHAVQLRERAEQAYREDDYTASEILAEHSLSAFQHAVVQARLVKATQRIERAERMLAATEERLQVLQQRQQVTEAEAQALELRARVIRDAEPKGNVERSSPAREAARQRAARSVSEAARLLCLATRMLAPSSERVEKLNARLDELDRELRGQTTPVPIDVAFELRAECLRALSLARREGRQASPEDHTEDLLFTQIAQALPEHPPVRDDRGIVISAADLLAKNQRSLAQDGSQLIEKVAAISAANPRFPLLVVLHGAPARTAKLRDLIDTELKRHGLSNVPFHDAGTHLPPAVEPIRGTTIPANRVEFVLVGR